MKTSLWIIAGLSFVTLAACTSTPPLMVEQCSQNKTLPADYDKSGKQTETVAYPCWEPAKVGDAQHVRKTRLLYLMDQKGELHSQEVGP